MHLHRNYKKIPISSFKKGDFELIPIRNKDQFLIMKWRNEQLHVLRQVQPLTEDIQRKYFLEVVDKLFEVEFPDQILFSFLLNGELVGYGGFVHIDWAKGTAEISFLTETKRSLTKELFISDWIIFLDLLKNVAHDFLNFKSVYTYAYDVRPFLYIAVENAGFKEVQRITEVVEINDEKKDIVIHQFDLNELKIRSAGTSDLDLYFLWANDSAVRKHSFQQDDISYAEHTNWFQLKLKDENCFMYVFSDFKSCPVGQVRIQIGNKTIINISIAVESRGKSYGVTMLQMACEAFYNIQKNRVHIITAFIKKSNLSSYRVFTKVSFREIECEDQNIYEMVYSYHE